MTHFEKFQALVGDAEFTAPISPAISLSIVTEYDDEGYPIYSIIEVGDRMVSPSGKLYKVVGFTKADTLVCTQSGFDIDPAIRFIEHTGEGLSYADEPTTVMQHQDSLV